MQEIVVHIDKNYSVDEAYNLIKAVYPNENPTTIDEWNELSKKLSNYQFLIGEINVKETDDIEKVVFLVNCCNGPKVLKTENKGYGLFADKDYYEELQIVYNGKRTSGHGEYVLWNPYMKYGIDSAFGYSIDCKGRWINDTQEVRETSHNGKKDAVAGNMIINYWVNNGAIEKIDDYKNFLIQEHTELFDDAEESAHLMQCQPIEKGEEILLDYGKKYGRPWLEDTREKKKKKEKEEVNK